MLAANQGMNRSRGRPLRSDSAMTSKPAFSMREAGSGAGMDPDAGAGRGSGAAGSGDTGVPSFLG